MVAWSEKKEIRNEQIIYHQYDLFAPDIIITIFLGQ
jgi:hypothetical protein